MLFTDNKTKKTNNNKFKKRKAVCLLTKSNKEEISSFITYDMNEEESVIDDDVATIEQENSTNSSNRQIELNRLVTLLDKAKDKLMDICSEIHETEVAANERYNFLIVNTAPGKWNFEMDILRRKIISQENKIITIERNLKKRKFVWDKILYLLENDVNEFRRILSSTHDSVGWDLTESMMREFIYGDESLKYHIGKLIYIESTYIHNNISSNKLIKECKVINADKKESLDNGIEEERMESYEVFLCVLCHLERDHNGDNINEIANTAMIPCGHVCYCEQHMKNFLGSMTDSCHENPLGNRWPCSIHLPNTYCPICGASVTSFLKVLGT